MIDFLWHLVSELWVLVFIMAAAWQSFMFASFEKHGQKRSKRLTDRHIFEHNIAALVSMLAGLLAAPVFIVHLMAELTLENEAPIGGIWQWMESVSVVFAAASYLMTARHLRHESDARLCKEYFQ